MEFLLVGAGFLYFSVRSIVRLSLGAYAGEPISSEPVVNSALLDRQPLDRSEQDIPARL